MTLTKLATLVVLGAFMLLPLHSQASVSGDIAAGLPADEVIANALADGLNIDQIADQIAQEVGSNNIGLFRAAMVRTLATATDSDPGDPGLNTAVNAAIGAANANNHGGRTAGSAYAMNSARFAPVDAASIRATTGILALSSVAGPAGFLAGGPGAGGARPGGGAPGGGGGGGGGSALADAACEAIGSEPGCLD